MTKRLFVWLDHRSLQLFVEIHCQEAKCASDCVVCAAVMGKAEGSVAREEWHGHVTALSVAPEFRRLGLAAKLMEMLEEISERSALREQVNDTVEHYNSLTLGFASRVYSI